MGALSALWVCLQAIGIVGGESLAGNLPHISWLFICGRASLLAERAGFAGACSIFIQQAEFPTSASLPPDGGRLWPPGGDDRSCCRCSLCPLGMPASDWGCRARNRLQANSHITSKASCLWESQLAGRMDLASPGAKGSSFSKLNFPQGPRCLLLPHSSPLQALSATIPLLHPALSRAPQYCVQYWSS